MYTKDEERECAYLNWKTWLIVGLGSIIIFMMVYFCFSTMLRTSKTSTPTRVVILSPKIQKPAVPKLVPVTPKPFPQASKAAPIVSNMEKIVKNKWDLINQALRKF